MFNPQPKTKPESKEAKKARQLKHAYEHKLEKAKERVEKLKLTTKERIEKYKIKAKKKKPESMMDIKRRLQKLVNLYIRQRDAGKPCISCGKPIVGQVHAGHYISQGMHGFLRYHLDNISAQCPNCNVWLRGNLIKYRMNLVKKIGLERVEYLEDHMNDIKKWTRDELIAIEVDIKERLGRL